MKEINLSSNFDISPYSLPDDMQIEDNNWGVDDRWQSLLFNNRIIPCFWAGDAGPRGSTLTNALSKTSRSRGKGGWRRGATKKCRKEATRLLYWEPGAYDHCATPSQSSGDMLPNEGEHGTETDGQTDKQWCQRDWKILKAENLWIDRPTEHLKELRGNDKAVAGKKGGLGSKSASKRLQYKYEIQETT